MKFDQKAVKGSGENEEPAVWNRGQEAQGQDLDLVLRDFRTSIHAWSEATYNRPRPLAAPARMAWRKAAAWALGCVLAAGIAGGGVLEHRHQQELARVAAAREAQRQRALIEQRAQEAARELAKIDSDVAREVPDAMEPLARLMTEDGGQ